LKECGEVFEEFKGLPPSREVDHKIPLKSGIEAINVRPCRYPHLLKLEIEKQVEEMLQMGIINNNPYSNLIILAKKEGSWLFCVDYRALNKATILDKFLILVIEELLDEFHDARYFSKINLRSGYHRNWMHEEDIQKTIFCTHMDHYESLIWMHEEDIQKTTFCTHMDHYESLVIVWINK